MARLPFRPTRLPRPRPVPTVSPTPAPTTAPNNAFTLTTNIETLPAAGVTAAANAVFTAPAGVTPQGVQANTLQSGDVLNGGGGTNVLNATFVNGAVTAAAPTINNIPTVNITTLAAGNSLNLGASTGVTTIGDINSVANTVVTGIKSPITTLNKTGGISRDTTITSQSAVLNGLNNALQINLSGVDGGNINATPLSPSSTNGYETFNVAVTGASTVGRLIAGPSLDNITVSGSALEIEGEAGFTAIDPGLLSFNASAMTGPLIVGNIENGVSPTEGASVVNAAAENLNFVGSNNGTVLFVESASLGQGDTLNGGTGANDVLTLTGGSVAIGQNGVVQPNNGAFTATGFETLAITDTRGNGVGVRPFNNPAAFNLANVSAVSTVQLGTASSTVVGLTNLKYSGPLAINVTGTGESTVTTGNGVNAVFSGAFGDADTVNYTFGNRGRALNSNNNLTLGQLSLPNIENVNLTFNDLTSNTRVAFNGFTPQPANSLFANASNVRFLTVNSQSGDDDANAINLGEIGTEVRGGFINSNAGVTARFNNRSGATFDVTGAGDAVLIVANEGTRDSTINGNTGTGDQTFSVAEAGTGVAQGRALLTSGSGDDTLIGGNGNDVLTGNTGDDRLRGDDGIDVLSGGDNNDDLNGDAGNDVVDGGAGNDIVAGGTGGDVLTGGLGADRFVGTVDSTPSGTVGYGPGDSLAPTALASGRLTFANGVDVVTDFNQATGDNILLDFVNTGIFDVNAQPIGFNGIATIDATGLIDVQTAATQRTVGNNTAVFTYFIRGDFSGQTFTGSGTGSDFAIFQTNAAITVDFNLTLGNPDNQQQPQPQGTQVLILDNPVFLA
jgi:Ca2+-binding RTX toxin-like protein